MKKQIMMTAISLCSLTWAMDHKAQQKGKQSDIIQPFFKPTPPQSMERDQEANLLLPRLSGHATHNTTSLHQTSIFTVHRAKL